MSKKDEDKYSDFENVERMRNYLIPEQMPEGPYGSPINKDEPVQNKSTPWREGQRYYSAFNYPDKDQHDNIPRRVSPYHPLHDEPENHQEDPNA
ncbi:cytosolic protein [Radiobacillus kanasensis]|uniref:cytosolic protein n=1 Tax=Radiobacillus kanasensis TaxID=2844358 RepID=UPI001E2B30B0|nr:cytosolic protein [Radiobacillus kanasensis]UFT98231.1 cytosolic protein [Radiobacillus kanasensis]